MVMALMVFKVTCQRTSKDSSRIHLTKRTPQRPFLLPPFNDECVNNQFIKKINTFDDAPQQPHQSKEHRLFFWQIGHYKQLLVFD